MNVDLLLSTASQLDTGHIRALALNVRNGAIALDKALVIERNTRRLGDLRRELHNLESSLGVTGQVGRVGAGADRAASVDYDTAKVRAWALDNGWDVAAKGRYLPVDVVAAWRASGDGAL
jgi:hypothetical protein